MSARQVGSELRMLAAGLLLGHLVLQKPAAPEPVVVRVAEPEPKPDKRRPSFANNALITGLIAAIVSGVISFAVAHYQSQDSAAQARRSQDIASLIQLESAATNYELATLTYVNSLQNCATGKEVNSSACRNPKQSWFASYTEFRNAYANVSNKQTVKYATDLNTAGDNAISYADGPYGEPATSRLIEDYYTLLQRCGQLIQGQT